MATLAVLLLYDVILSSLLRRSSHIHIHCFTEISAHRVEPFLSNGYGCNNGGTFGNFFLLHPCKGVIKRTIEAR
jgi:hypothetical protein